jgi:predicted SAM-dependent methyltransferase
VFGPFRKQRPEDRTRARVAELLRAGPDIKLDIGSGPIKGGRGWTTLDLNDKADLYWDLREPLPFPDGSVAMIYSSHVLEHFFYPELMRLLHDCLRILKPQGVFSVCVPDASIYVRGYLEHESFDRGKFLVYAPALPSDSRMDILNYIAYMAGHHRYMFDAANLVAVLQRAGFDSVRQREFDPAIDLQARDFESIYAIGVKA